MGTTWEVNVWGEGKGFQGVRVLAGGSVRFHGLSQAIVVPATKLVFPRC